MPAALFQRLDLDLLYLPFLSDVLEVIAECHSAGDDYVGTRGFASYAQQDALHAQGRTAPGKVVTAARGGQSAHNFGLAIDFTHDSDLATPGLQPDWKAANYARLGAAVAKRPNLVWGGTFSKPDAPHVQWSGYVTGAQLAPLDAIFRASPLLTPPLDRLRKVWAEVSKV